MSNLEYGEISIVIYGECKDCAYCKEQLGKEPKCNLYNINTTLTDTCEHNSCYHVKEVNS